MDAFLDLEKSAEVAGESSAILSPGQPVLNYSALWQRVLNLRYQLAGAGLAPGSANALVFPDGPDFLVALLAATAFGPCAPLDPMASQQEYAPYFSHLRASTLIAPANSVAIEAAKAQGMNIVTLCGTKRGPLPQPASTSLLMFTSSTTGRPKLVPVTSDNLAASCRSEARVLDLTAQDRLLNLTPQFNLRGLRAALTQLSLGGSVASVPSFDPDSFPQWLRECNPTWISVSATWLGALCSLSRRIPDLWRDTSVRFIRTGGTAPEPRQLRDLEALSEVPVLDGYGTTETGCVTRATIGFRKIGSVGRTTGTQIAILSETGDTLGPCVAGEIAVRGPNVTSGYIDDEEANRRAFHHGWFRTRDLGYLDEEGFLFLTGRIDDVINRGGQKVLPREVEFVLMEHPSVREAAVFGAPHRTLGHQVVAAVVASQPVSEIQLRRFATGRLTSYKVPHSILFVDHLPRNATGKLQRQQLRDAYHERPNLESLDPLATDTEKAIAAMWEQELRQGPVSRDADFSRLGGDSLTAALIGTRIQTTFGLTLDLRAFTENPKLHDLSRFVDELRQGRREQLEALDYAPRNQPVPLSFAQQRTWKYAASANYNVAFAHLLRGPLDPEILRRAMLHLAARHEILRTTFEQSGANPTQIVHATPTCDLAFADVSDLPEPAQQARRILDESASQPFDLARGPLVRFLLVRLNDDEHWLIRVNHHLISDAHSWRLYFSELSRVYEDLLHGREPQPLYQKQAEYGDYALWQQREFSPLRRAHRKSLDWWVERFSQVHSPQLFHDSIQRAERRPGDPVCTSPGALTWGVDPATSSRLDRLQCAEGATFFEIRLAAFTALLADLTDQRQVILGTHFSFRHRLEWQNVLGDFTNLATLLLKADPAQTFRESVRTAHATARETSAHGEIPYELLRQELQARGVVAPPIGVMFYSAEQTVPALMGDVEMTWLYRAAPVMPWGFSMFMDKHNEDRLCLALFDAGLYQPEAVGAFVARFGRFLDAASLFPDRQLHHLLAASRRNFPSLTVGAR